MGGGHYVLNFDILIKIVGFWEYFQTQHHILKEKVKSLQIYVT